MDIKLIRQLIRTSTFEAEKAELYLDLAKIYKERSVYSEAEHAAIQAAHFGKLAGLKKTVAEATQLLGSLYFQWGYYEKALQSTFQALTIYEEIAWLAGVSTCYNNIGAIYNIMNQQKKAMEFYLRAVSIQEKQEDKANLALTMNNLGILYFELKQLDSALVFLQKSREIFESLGKLVDCVSCLINIGEIYSYKENYKISEEHYRTALKISSENLYIEGILYANINLGKLFLHLNKLGVAVEYLHEALTLARKHFLRIEEKKVHDILANLYEQKRDYINAYRHFDAFFSISENVFDHATQLRLEELQGKLEAQLREKEAEIFRIRTEELQQTLEETNKAYTRLKSMQEELIVLEQKNTALAMAVTANHEVNQPLMILSANAEMLQMYLGESEFEEEFNLLTAAVSSIKEGLKHWDKQLSDGNGTSESPLIKILQPVN